MDLYVVTMFQSVTVVTLFDLGKLLCVFWLHCTAYLNLSSPTRDWILGHGSEITGRPGNSQVTFLTSLCPITYYTYRYDTSIYQSQSYLNYEDISPLRFTLSKELRICLACSMYKISIWKYNSYIWKEKPNHRIYSILKHPYFTQ